MEHAVGLNVWLLRWSTFWGLKCYRSEEIRKRVDLVATTLFSLCCRWYGFLYFLAGWKIFTMWNCWHHFLITIIHNSVFTTEYACVRVFLIWTTYLCRCWLSFCFYTILIVSFTKNIGNTFKKKFPVNKKKIEEKLKT